MEVGPGWWGSGKGAGRTRVLWEERDFKGRAARMHVVEWERQVKKTLRVFGCVLMPVQEIQYGFKKPLRINLMLTSIKKKKSYSCTSPSAWLGSSCGGSSYTPRGDRHNHQCWWLIHWDECWLNSKHKLLYRTSGFCKNFGLGSNTKVVWIHQGIQRQRMRKEKGAAFVICLDW